LSAALVFAWCGTAVFTVSLLFFLERYLIAYGRPADGPLTAGPIVWNVILFTAFAVHHSVLARPAVRARVAAAVPAPLERSVYTWTSSLLFIAVCAWWQPVPGVVYELGGAAAIAAWCVLVAGIVVTLRGAARLDVLDLSGVRAVVRQRQPGPPEHVPLETRGLYGFVRHPVYFGWVLIVFGTPHMTATRLVFALVSTAYLVLAVPFEERSLIRAFGAQYQEYQRRVRWRIVPYVY
jgi:protein-S-isoprenylcysteine O-methyltransferase Ste14